MNKKFLANLRPGIAGYIVDGRIADKEVVATVVDFIIKGYIDFFPKTTKWEKLKVDKLVFSNKARPSLKFENEFLKTIFSNKNEIIIAEFRGLLASKKLHGVLENEVKYSDVGIDIVDEETKFYLGKESKENVVEFSYKDLGDKTYKRVKTLEDWNKFKNIFNFISIVFGIVLVVLLFVIIKNIISKNFEFLPVPIFVFIFFSVIMYFFFYLRKHTTKIDEQKIKYKDQITKNLRNKYHELFDFVKKNPIKEGRLFNEFLPYTIAFGFDTYWQKAFSLYTEKEEFIYRG